MGQLTVPLSGAIYLDADAIIYAVEKVEPYYSLLLPLLGAVNRRVIGLIGSELLLVETLVKPVEQGDPALEASFRRFLTTSREMQLLPISRPILERALKLRAAHRVRTPDAIHAATALIAGCTLFATNDPVFRRVSGLQAVILDDYV